MSLLTIKDLQELDKNITNTYDDIGRVYHIPDTNNSSLYQESNTSKAKSFLSFYSVTSVLGATGDKSFLDEWRNRVGHEEAERITRKACLLGTEYHLCGENYLLGEDQPDVQWKAKFLFDKTKSIIDKHVNEVLATELLLFSVLAKIAGRADAVLVFDNVLSIFDFKCIKHLNPAWMEEYWLQMTMYKLCLKEVTGLDAQNLVLVCANKENNQTNYFTKKPDNVMIKKAVQRIKAFHKQQMNTTNNK